MLSYAGISGSSAIKYLDTTGEVVAASRTLGRQTSLDPGRDRQLRAPLAMQPGNDEETLATPFLFGKLR